MSFTAALVLFATLGLGSSDYPYPFAPFTDPEERRMAERLERRFAQRDGVVSALQHLCHGDEWDVERLVASQFLIEHIGQSLPRILATIRWGDRDDAGESARACGFAAWILLTDAICFGYSIGGSGPEMDAHPLAVEGRDRTFAAFASALALHNSLSYAALDVLVHGIDPDGPCAGGRDAVFRLTAQLVAFLGVLKPPLHVPRSPNGASDAWEIALRTLSYGTADRRLAETPVRKLLQYDETFPLATVSLARMGVDMTAVVPHLARTLDAIHLAGSAAQRQDELILLDDAADAVALIGRPAISVLPSLARLARSEVPNCAILGIRRYAALVRATYAPGQAQYGVAVLAPLIHCRGNIDIVLRSLGDLGQASADTLLGALRDTTLSVRNRIESARIYREVLGRKLSEADRKMLRGLSGYLPSSPNGTFSPKDTK